MDDEEKESTWGDILKALKAVDKSGFEPLHHVAGVTYLMKRHHHQPVAEEHEEFVVRKLEGPQQVAPLSGRASNEGSGIFHNHTNPSLMTYALPVLLAPKFHVNLC